MATISTAMQIPPITITVLSMASAILTTIGTKFNFKEKTNQLNLEIQKLHRLSSKLQYVVSCNGSLTEEAYKQIMSEFT